ncbi:MAG: nickel pincer cofactor biosynthesis protein LarC [Cyclobacteriaceae bacterium]|nr:nickel pincer cofactor biosynthesis protein LarC [Cyclobacteriaceae bacterium]
MNILKIEAFSGLSGDMFLGALTELADAYDEIAQLPKLLHLDKVEVKITHVEKAGIACRHIKILDNNEYYDQKPIQAQQAVFEPGKSQFALAPKKPHHHHRHLQDIEKIIDSGELSDGARQIAKEIFHILGKAEAKVHGVDINTIHFHEVGAIDSILDIVGTALLLDKLNIRSAVSTAICTGHGFVMADHGRMPIPAPATKELLLDMPTYAGTERGEMTTPTGAAILRFLQPTFDIPALVEKKTGHGPGEKNFAHPNVLRLSLCETDTARKDELFMLETNIDDMSSELLGTDFQAGLLKAGAVDFYFTHILMKKGRPGTLISIFAHRHMVDTISSFLLENTSTIGVRYYPVHRQILSRSLKSVKTSLGEVDVKEVILPSGKKRLTLEYDSCSQIAKKLQIPVAEVFAQLNKEI